MIQSSEHAGYSISTNVADFDLPRIHKWLSEIAYWSKGIPFDICKKSFENSLSYGLFHKVNQSAEFVQIGCARMITDEATFAYLADVFIDAGHRGNGLGYWFVETIMADDKLSGIRRMMLATSNMHSLYEKFGFEALKQPEIMMENTKPDIYKICD
ncbi:GNAT family N-acetyltransferase [Kordiimonas sp. SCSIO 12610]|uniref:GNAT family N-acetyltransferase n=1 Tax=Kordiimonas sp. SCSIO 12610 TaxID=2829597 RepID=UPI00210CCBD8|nr:GNAT family N-acetyltransferase [Kordiimonas sp. SCSIO 12610]UTW53879.1 GNAT family N-acetyltransferase [Kordiimonas sp. SCSIO 12610]